MQARTVVVTGAGRGIGLEITRELAVRGDTVIAAVRKTNAELDTIAANKKVEIVSGVDVTGPGAGDAVKAKLGDRKIDVLILNAGILEPQGSLDIDIDSIERQFAVNAVGPLRITKALLGNLDAGAKIAILTSRMGSIADNGSGGFYGYRMSKTAVNMAGVSLARDLLPKKIAVVLLHPGYVKTDMTRGGGDIEPSQAAKRIVTRIDELTLAGTGKFLHANGEELPW